MNILVTILGGFVSRLFLAWARKKPEPKPFRCLTPYLQARERQKQASRASEP